MLDLDAEAGFRTNPEAALARYQERGFHVERDLIPPALCDRLIAAAQRLPSATEGHYRPAMMPHRLDPLFLEPMGLPAVLDIMRYLIGDPVSGLQTEFFYTKPGTRGFAIHQDNFFVEAPDGCFGSAWMALTDVHPEMGALYVYPGAHRHGLLPVRRLSGGAGEGQDPNAYNEEVVLPEDTGEPVVVALPRGAVVFLHGLLPHGSLRNDTDRYRYALLCTYLRSGSPFRRGNHARREELALPSAS